MQAEQKRIWSLFRRAQALVAGSYTHSTCTRPFSILTAAAHRKLSFGQFEKALEQLVDKLQLSGVRSVHNLVAQLLLPASRLQPDDPTQVDSTQSRSPQSTLGALFDSIFPGKL